MIANLALDRDVFTSNVFLVTGERTALVDVGNEFDVVEAVRDRVDDLDVVVLTHTHYDHVGNLESVLDAFDVEVVAFDGDADGVTRTLGDGGTVQIGDHEYVALHTPGHKNDHLCLYSEAAGVLFAGDLVFAGGSFGRTDLDEGDRPTLIESIERVLDVVDGAELRELHTGHGPSVESNPYQTIQMAHQAAQF
ncbi:Glyoxylase, beta-lactamase superfamily II [Halomicrobium zhouii]|uniref:Glyoxylase, beta-lactamase superfamily II n=1 Tax=Halomicrobium zhouii TaxID=767519 RepID=A0A1I6LWK6_9EURY|nr:MBL fold metallo-hydrolase [Halomicrobium zhouii]SFS07829.1 Glyoxylase, beta-lactamase superfamily II [Halomicrobium zhouii]